MMDTSPGDPDRGYLHEHVGSVLRGKQLVLGHVRPKRRDTFLYYTGCRDLFGKGGALCTSPGTDSSNDALSGSTSRPITDSTTWWCSDSTSVVISERE
jgi:hypothetical protein